tara:strand:- start:789 stop:1100 length:312 start_codon:yes stop_codon:yes gene_type:complete
MVDQTIYEQMSMQRIEIVAAQISLLNNYDPSGMKQRTQELYDVSHISMIDAPSEHAIEEMEGLIKQYQDEIQRFRELFPDMENKQKVRNNLVDLEKLCRSCGL